MLYVATVRQATCEGTTLQHPCATKSFQGEEYQQLWHLQVRLGAAVGHAGLVRPHELLEAPLYTLPHQVVAPPQRSVLPADGVQTVCSTLGSTQEYVQSALCLENKTAGAL